MSPEATMSFVMTRSVGALIQATKGVDLGPPVELFRAGR
jgi:hypothetical protein